jgi:nitrate/nitrite transporter NarK
MQAENTKPLREETTMRRWLVVVGCTLGLAVSFGPYFWLSIGLFLKPMTTEFAWSRTQFSAMYSLASVMNVLMLPVCGYIVDRFGPVRAIVAGTVLGAAAYASFSLVHSYQSFLIVACVVGGVGTIASYSSYLALVPKWFDRNLGVALAIAACGIGIGAAVFPHIISAGIQHAGWRNAFVYAGAVILVVGLCSVVLFVRDNRGPVPEVERRTHLGIPAVHDWSLGAALRSRDFWFVAVAFAGVLAVTNGINFHFAALINDRAGSSGQAASALATLALSSLAARLLTGFLLDRMSVRVIAALFFFGQAAASLLLIPKGINAITLSAVLIGAAQGAELDLLPFIVARRFGKLAYSKIYSCAFAVILMGQVLSPLLLGFAFDKTGSYVLGLSVFPFLSSFAVLLVWFAKTDQTQVGMDVDERVGAGRRWI